MWRNSMLFLLFLAFTTSAKSDSFDEFSIMGLGMSTHESGRIVTKLLSNKGKSSTFYLYDNNIENFWNYSEEPWALGNDNKFWKIQKNDSNSFFSFIDLNHAISLGFDGAYLSVLQGSDKVYRLGIAWVKFDKNLVRQTGECGRPDTWVNGNNDKAWHCIERHSDSKYVVKMRDGHPGFPLMEIAARNRVFRRYSSDQIASQIQLPSLLATTDLASEFSKNWLLTSYDNSREVEFWLYQDNEYEPYRYATGQKAKPGKIVSTKNGKPLNTCGGPSSACPIFYDPEDPSELELLEYIYNNRPNFLTRGNLY